MTTLDDAIAMAYVSGSVSQVDKDTAAQKADRMAQAKRLWATQSNSATGPPATAPAGETKSLNKSQNERLKALRQKHLQQTRTPQLSAAPVGPYCSRNTHTRATSAISERSSSSTHSGLSMTSPDSAISATFDGLDDSEDESLESKYRALQQDLDDLHWVDEAKGSSKTMKISSRYYANHNHLSLSQGHSDNLVRFTAKGIMWIGPETEELEPTGSAQSHQESSSISSAASTASTFSINSLYTVQDVSYMYAEERVHILQEDDEWVDLLEGGFCGEKAGRPVMKRMVW
ncbi:hypothetical protein CJU90_1222 [Yarrowia sp. C11]|nr:hypothetical protein CKK34_2636 [Yarrowia sp. E02]KAG5373509.1 hypothetical protein CJU90_1222 [Yarrowia sp. C11]